MQAFPFDPSAQEDFRCPHELTFLPAALTAGLPIRPIFSTRLPGRRAMKRRLGLETKLPAVLLVGGGEGMGALEATVLELGKHLGRQAQVGGRKV